MKEIKGTALVPSYSLPVMLWIYCNVSTIIVVYSECSLPDYYIYISLVLALFI
jgi:hypothetical protein